MTPYDASKRLKELRKLREQRRKALENQKFSLVNGRVIPKREEQDADSDYEENDRADGTSAGIVDRVRSH